MFAYSNFVRIKNELILRKFLAVMRVQTGNKARQIGYWQVKCGGERIRPCDGQSP
jgi:hypothetical protein